MLSSDVSSAFDPTYASSFDKKNVAYLGGGMVINKFTGARGKSGSNDANAEYLAHLRHIFDKAEVNFQTAELGKVDLEMCIRDRCYAKVINLDKDSEPDIYNAIKRDALLENVTVDAEMCIRDRVSVCCIP